MAIGATVLETLRSFHCFSLIRAGSDFEKGLVRQVISTGDVARDGAIIEPSGWDLRNYMRNPVVLYAHDDSAGGWVGVTAGTRAALPVAKATDVGLNNGNLEAEAQFDMDDEFAVRLLGKIRGGFINATSVRWRPLTAPKREVREVVDDDGVTREREVWVFSRNELLEYSYVPIPADPGAVIQRAAGGAVDFSALAGAEPAPASPQLSRTSLLDAVPQLVEFLRTARLDEAERDAAARIYAALAEVLEPAPVVDAAPVRADVSPELMAAVEQLAAEAASRLLEPPDVTDAVAGVLARHTGRTLDDIRRSLQRG